MEGKKRENEPQEDFNEWLEIQKSQSDDMLKGKIDIYGEVMRRGIDGRYGYEKADEIKKKVEALEAELESRKEKE